jgi:hypothetical protein
MEWAGVWDDYKQRLRRELEALGAPLGEAFARGGLRATLGGLALPPHALVATDQALCAVAGREHVLRSDIAGIVPLPAAWRFSDDPAKREKRERVFMHMLVLVARALKEQFHAMMRETLGPHVVAGEGVMAADGDWRLTAPKGVARMDAKRVTDHGDAPGCLPALNIDVLRVIGVCATADKLRAALAALGARFEGCGRVKNGFEAEDASHLFHLRTLMANMVVDFGCTYTELAAQPGVSALWHAHVESAVVPEGGAPPARWQADAREALSVLTGAELASRPVRFICEAQLVLADVYEVRKHMHEPYKGYRADNDALLHEDMLHEPPANGAVFAAGLDVAKAPRELQEAALARVMATCFAPGGELDPYKLDMCFE